MLFILFLGISPPNELLYNREIIVFKNCDSNKPPAKNCFNNETPPAKIVKIQKRLLGGYANEVAFEESSFYVFLYL